MFIIISARQFDHSFVLNVYGRFDSLLIWKLTIHELSSNRLAILPLSSHLLIPSLLLEEQAHLITPSDQTRPEDHHGEEKVDWLRSVLVEKGLLPRLLANFFRQ